MGLAMIPVGIGEILLDPHSDQSMIFFPRALLPLILDVQLGLWSISSKILLEGVAADVEEDAHKWNDCNLKEGKPPVEFVVGVLADHTTDVHLGASMLRVIVCLIPTELLRKLLELRRIAGNAPSDGGVCGGLIDKMVTVGIEPDEPTYGAGSRIMLIGDFLNTIDLTGCDVADHPHDGFAVQVECTFYGTDAERVIV